MTTGQIPLTEGPERRYAKALYELATENKATDAVAKDLSSFAKILENADFQAALNSPVLDNAAKEKLLQTLADTAKVSKLTKNFISLVSQKGRAELLAGMAFWFDYYNAAAKGEVTAVVTSAAALTKTQQKEVIKFAEEKCKDAKSIKLVEDVDPSVIAGTKIRLGSTQYDATLQGRIQRVKNRLSK